ncbi:MAG: methyltransferase domain-containing protein [Patescibacteria group bacterium]|jgi:2-polyprenyl-3-methyl-5-hydroxy-6-metoxy-1,4-benzoquinol methylase
MAVDTRIYDQRFFDRTLKLEESSAKAVVNILIKRFRPKSVIDIGCGIGIYLKEFEKKGIGISGYDGAPAAIKNSLVGDKIKYHDLVKPLRLSRKFDLCLCVEVAEHLPETCENTLINSLVRLSDTLIYTAATPGQGDLLIGHINERPHAYWKKKLKASGFTYKTKLTGVVRKEMAEKKAVWWVAKNLMVFQKNEKNITR